MGTPLCLGGTAQWQQSLLSPRSPNTPVQITLLPATPCLGFFGCQPLPGAERSRGGPGVVWWGGLIPSPHRFCAAPCHCHPCNISGFGELVWGGVAVGRGCRVHFGVHCRFLAVRLNVKLNGVCGAVLVTVALRVPERVVAEPPWRHFQRANPAPGWLGSAGGGEIKGLYQNQMSRWLHGVPCAGWGGHRSIPSSPSHLCKLSQD